MTVPRILIVDDSGLTRSVLVQVLSRAGFEVLEAHNGAEGAVMALRERPSAVVTDLEMPLMDGGQLARLLKDDPVTRETPVVILTSHGEAPSRFWGLKTGADRYVTKDSVHTELVSILTELIPRDQKQSQVSDSPPEGAMEVMARVARQLDQQLLHTTLFSSVLEAGMKPVGWRETALALLELLNELMDAWAVSIAISEPHGTFIDTFQVQGISGNLTEAMTQKMRGRLPDSSKSVVKHSVTQAPGQGPQGPLDVDRGLFFAPLPLRDAAGILAVLPREASEFHDKSWPLVEPLLPQLALVLDNARMADRLRELSTLDSLTLAFNHRNILERLGAELDRWERYREPVSVILLDLDNFKQVNDTYGHPAGDMVLVEVAERIGVGRRSVDAVGRYGGEEFLVVLPETNLAGACTAAERIRRTLDEMPMPLPGARTTEVTASFGVASCQEVEPPVSPQSLVSLADNRLYQAKEAGRNCVRPEQA